MNIESRLYSALSRALSIIRDADWNIEGFYISKEELEALEKPLHDYRVGKK